MRKFLILLTMFTFLIGLTADSFARAGKGSSSGFRNYKMQDLSKKNNENNLQQKQYQQSPAYYSQQKTYQQKPSFFSNPVFKWLIGGLIFGAILSLLMGYGLQFGMPGLLEILLLIGIAYFLFRMLARKKQNQPAYATNADLNYQTYQYFGSQNQGSTTSYINQELILNLAKSIFYDIQKAWSDGDLLPVKNFLTDRMYQYLQDQLKELKAKSLKNIVENPKIENIEIVHVEEEGDNKVVIVKIDASAIDYTVDSHGNVVEGDKNNPAEFTEYWAFVGKALNWKLDDIKQVSDV